jgi:hypothetical protein
MEQERNPERGEVYERIPWEMLDQKKGDRQWLVFAAAGAVVLGALAYSFMSNRSQAVPAVQPVATGLPAPPAGSPVPVIPVAPQAPIPTSPVIVAEADLYAVDPERLIDSAVAHAEWFITEYFTLDGSVQHTETLAALMPVGIPHPTAEEGTRVFVESVAAVEVEELQPLHYEVGVLVRYLKAVGEEGYQRQPPMLATVGVVVGEGGPRVTLPPQVAAVTPLEPVQPALTEVPTDVAALVPAQSGATEILGGTPRVGGGWTVVALVAGNDGIVRPISVIVP